MTLAALALFLAPWTGPPLPAVSGATAKYRLTVRGEARQSIDLRADGAPPGWIASFCTSSLCAPFRYRARLDARGRATLEFALIKTDPHAARRVRILISSPGAKPVAVTFER